MDLNAVSAVDLAYIAGFIDGEGHIQLTRDSLRVVIANTHLETLLWMQSLVEGSIRIIHKGRSNRWRPCYVLDLSTRPAARLLEMVAPYLRVKSEEADIALRFVTELRNGPGPGRGRAGARRLTDVHLARREKLRQEIKELRHRLHGEAP